MKKYYRHLWKLLPAFGMLALILDSRTAMNGASDGVALCIRTVIPSLLPFFVLSNLIISCFSGKEISILSPFERMCGIPHGQGTLFLLGLLGGYPIGAQGVYHAWKRGQLNASTAKRLLGFCSNPGPSFIFGIAASLFCNKSIGMILWLIQIISALLVGALLPSKEIAHQSTKLIVRPNNTDILLNSMKALATVCGWVVLMRVLIAFTQRWFLWMLPQTVAVAITGLLELANGCCDLINIPAESVRFILCCAMLSCGGICVLIQTLSVTKELGIGWYVPGKLLQSSISVILSTLIAPILFHENNVDPYPFLCISVVVIIIFILWIGIYRKNR